ncbi:NTP transferase domain-containing protein [Fuchsiella alkaliacetigena]|uniref:NTP transferase domain-containing protein n=1 Tax=Fuchsiella alkaliacetigena TaxID=957042 RepID=UPI00200AA1CD|nr:NTP transferase domain-containing protein [Fuchsiella alkaliacetigena]MCK8825953.1 NTP transferase domain-containing protein [Fuchsiella alkaliacetigena]
MDYNAVILAGAKNTNLVAKDITVNYEALLQVIQRPMITYILRSLVTAEKIKDILVIGPKEEEKLLLANGADSVVETKDNLLDNIELGIQYMSQFQQDYFLLVSADIPLITAAAIDDFIFSCEEELGCGLYYPIIPKELSLATYPEADKTYLDLQEGSYTGGNLFLVNSELFISSRDLINRVLISRKNLLKLSWILGLKFLVKLLWGKLSLSEVENRVSELLDIPVKAIITEHPEIGFDVDKPADLERVRSLAVNN